MVSQITRSLIPVDDFRKSLFLDTMKKAEGKEIL
jgi:hypothetical protein